jgi:replication-associated recombination protein RarA
VNLQFSHLAPLGCWGILTQEVKALHDSYTEINANTPAKTPKGRIFISKAVILLCLAKKSRDADHLQNFVYDQQAGLEPKTLTDELEAAGEYVPILDYAYDCHTPHSGDPWASSAYSDRWPASPPPSRSTTTG